MLAEDIGKEDIGRLVGKDSTGVGAGAGGLDIWPNELFLLGAGRLGGGWGGGEEGGWGVDGVCRVLLWC